MNILTRVISTALDSVGRRLTKIRANGKDDVRAGFEIAPFGTDSNPPPGMVAIYAQSQNKGNQVIIGYINESQIAAIGEHRIYSTDENGELKFYVWLKNDGTLELGGAGKHLVRFEELKAGFDQLRTDFNAHVHANNGVPPTTPSTANIDSSKIDEIKTL